MPGWHCLVCIKPEEERNRPDRVQANKVRVAVSWLSALNGLMEFESFGKGEGLASQSGTYGTGARMRNTRSSVFCLVKVE